MPILLIIADDLTGAMDSGVKLAKRGIATVVSPQWQRVSEPHACETLVVNTETRHSTPARAAEVVATAVKDARKRGAKYFFKKTDSTLRGNIGSELEAFLDASMRKRLIFVPAFPQLGRTTRGGRQYVDGIPLQNTDYAHDPLNPVTTDDVAEIVRLQSNIKTYILSPNLIASIRDHSREGIFIINCEDETDLRIIGDAVRNLETHCAFAGSGAFAEELANLWGGRPSAGSPNIKLPKKMLVINGSLNPVAAQQILYAERSGLTVMCIDPCALSYGKGGDPGGCDRLISSVKEHPANPLILTSICHDIKSRWRPSVHDAMLDFAENLGRMVAVVLLQKTDCQLMMVIGGDTLAGVSSALECDSIVPLTEIFPGVVLSKLLSPGGEIYAISKAGGFGDEDVIVRACEWARSLQQ